VRLPAWAAVLLVPLVPWIQARIDAERRPQEHRMMASGLWSAAEIRRIAPGFDLLMADLYWLRTVQYFGSQRVFAGGTSYELLLPLANVTTDLDPRLEIAYRYGAIFLGEKTGANQPDLALELLRKGAEKNPLSWRLRQDLGFYHFLYKGDARTAARILSEARQIPGAPVWLESFAASVLRRGGERELSRQMWLRLYHQNDMAVLRESARRHLMNLDALDQVDAVRAVVDRFHEHEKRYPTSLHELEARGLLARPPIDPAGKALRYDAETGEVSLDPKSNAHIN
jgi:hypothetical protein